MNMQLRPCEMCVGTDTLGVVLAAHWSPATRRVHHGRPAPAESSITLDSTEQTTNLDAPDPAFADEHAHHVLTCVDRSTQIRWPALRMIAGDAR